MLLQMFQLLHPLFCECSKNTHMHANAATDATTLQQNTTHVAAFFF
jgi:hypothetical protein